MADPNKPGQGTDPNKPGQPGGGTYPKPDAPQPGK